MAQTSIITGQYVCIRQTAATVLQRLLACLIDAIILFFGCIILGYLFVPLAEQPHSTNFIIILMICCFIVLLSYPLVMELLCDGQTVGKFIFGIKVICLDGSKPSTMATLLRFLFLYIDLFFFGVGLASIIFTRNSQRLGDLAAGTTVVKLNRKKRPFVLDSLNFTNKDYTPSYPEVVRLSMRQMETIQHTLYSENINKQNDRMIQLSLKVEKVLGIRARELSYDDFLTTIYNDFLYYSVQSKL